MSPPRRPTGNPPGRPRKVAADAAADVVAEGRASAVDMAVKARVHPATIKRRLRERRAGKGAPAKPRGAAVPPPASPPAAPGPLDRLRAYAAHDPPALAALDALLVVDEGGLGRDELADLREGLRLAADVVREAAKAREEDGDGPLLRALQRLEGLGKTVATVKAKRPPQDGPDEATRRILAVRERALERIGVLAGDAAEAFRQRRAELEVWVGQNLGPVLGVEVQRRVGAMLGEKPAAGSAAA